MSWLRRLRSRHTQADALEAHEAAASGDADRLRSLLAKYPSLVHHVDEIGIPLIHHGFISADEGMVELLLESGASLSARWRGTTCLHIAARTGRTPLVVKCLSGGIDPNSTSEEGRTPLHEASCSGNTEVVRMLVANGGDLNVVTTSGDTPLTLAVIRQDLGMVSFLIQSGAVARNHDLEWADDRAILGALRARGRIASS